MDDDERDLRRENAALRVKLKEACDLARALDARFTRVWREAVKSNDEVSDITDGRSVKHVIDGLEGLR